MRGRSKSSYRYLTILGVALLFSGCNGRNWINSNSAMYTEENMNYFGTEKEQIDTLKEVEIKSSYADIEIIASDDYYIEYQYYYIDNEPVLTLEGGKLYFDDSNMNEGAYSISLSKGCYFKIYVPNTAEFNNVSIQTASGEISLGSFVTEELEVENSYGDVVISRVDSKESTVILNSGKLTMENSTLDNISIENSYGDVVLSTINYSNNEMDKSLLMEGDISIKMSSGNIKLKDISVESLSADNSYGDFIGDGLFTKEVNAELSSGNIEVNDSYVDKLDIQSSYGDIDLSLCAKEEEYRMNITSLYGDTRIGEEEYQGSVLIDKGGEKEIKIDASSGNIEIRFKE